jgi:hypothetical protein
MSLPNRERVARGLDHLKTGLTPFVERELKARLGGYWREDLESRLKESLPRDGDAAIRWDNQALLKAMIVTWDQVFRFVLGSMERSLVHELKEVRNRWAHEEPFSYDDTYRTMDSIQRLLESVGAADASQEVGGLKGDLQRMVFEEQSRNRTRWQMSLQGMPLPGLKPWREIVTPHPDVASGRYLQAEFAADLAQVHPVVGLGTARSREGSASPEYRDPAEFFRRTFITEGISDLLVGALQRLSGSGGDPVVELQTNFGGGKTHSMLALYHLFGGAPSSELVGLEPVLQKAGVTRAPTAKRAVLVGTHLSPAHVITKPDGVEVRTLWGELAWQLGGAEAFKIVAESDAKGVSPGSGLLAGLLDRYSPCLVLIDEWVAYARQIVGKRDLPSGDFEAQASFAQALTEAAKAAPRALVVASIPASRIEIGGENGEIALDVLRNVFTRVGRPWRPASADEGFEIVRRRLFQNISERQTFANRDAVVAAFAKMYKDNPGDFPSTTTDSGYREELRTAYPIHPELFHRLYDDWSTLDKFQRTRGVLRLLAKVVHQLWESQDAGLLILPSSVPLDDPATKSELTRYLDDPWEPIISGDVDGPTSIPLGLDRESPNLGRFSACRRVARTLYMGTAPGSKGRNPGIDDRQVRLGCAQPGEAVAIFGDALRKVSDRGRFVHQDGTRYWYSTQANLNRMADDQAASLLKEPETLWNEIIARLRKDPQRGDFAAVHVAPPDTGDVPDEATARLVILGPEVSHRFNQSDSSALVLAKKTLEWRGNSPRLNRNMLVFLAADTRSLEDLLQGVACFLAWKDIKSREDPLNLDSYGRHQAHTKREEFDRTVNLRLGTTWIHALVPVQPEATGEIQWQSIKIAGNDPLAKRTSTKLKMDEMLLPAMGGVRLRMELDRWLWQEKDHVTVGQLGEWFARYLYLPRVCRREVIETAVRDGAGMFVTSDTFAVAESFDEAKGRYVGLRNGGSPPVAVPSTMLVVKPKIAQAQVEKEREEIGRVPVTGEKAVTWPVSAGTTGQRGGGGEVQQPVTTTPPLPVKPVRPTRFYATAELSPDRAARDAGKVLQEVFQHLSTLPGARATVKLDMEVIVGEGFGEDVVRVVLENCNTLRITERGFERE